MQRPLDVLAQRPGHPADQRRRDQHDGRSRQTGYPTAQEQRSQRRKSDLRRLQHQLEAQHTRSPATQTKRESVENQRLQHDIAGMPNVDLHDDEYAAVVAGAQGDRSGQVPDVSPPSAAEGSAGEAGPRCRAKAEHQASAAARSAGVGTGRGGDIARKLCITLHSPDGLPQKRELGRPCARN